jgi:hypothetical protein
MIVRQTTSVLNIIHHLRKLITLKGGYQKQLKQYIFTHNRRLH